MSAADSARAMEAKLPIPEKLMLIGISDGNRRLLQLARFTGLDNNAVIEILDKLIRDGYVEVEPDAYSVSEFFVTESFPS